KQDRISSTSGTQSFEDRVGGPRSTQEFPDQSGLGDTMQGARMAGGRGPWFRGPGAGFRLRFGGGAGMQRQMQSAGPGGGAPQAAWGPRFGFGGAQAGVGGPVGRGMTPPGGGSGPGQWFRGMRMRRPFGPNFGGGMRWARMPGRRGP